MTNLEKIARLMFLSILKNNVSKSLLYILFFAGLLKLGGMIITWFWNNYMVYSFDLEYITFLESVGMIAFFYLVFSGVKFGFNTLANQINSKQPSSPGNLPQCKTCDAYQRSNGTQFVNKLSADEKEKLKQAIAKCCGFQHEPMKIDNKKQISIPHTSKINHPH